MQKKSLLVLTGGVMSLTALGLLLSNGALAANVYTDVSPSHWAYNAVQWASQAGIMTGPGNAPGTFNIAGFVNRAELVTVLQRQYNMIAKDMADMRVQITLLDQRVKALEGNRSSASSRSGQSSSSSATASFSAVLSGGQEVPFVSTNGSGMGSFTWNNNANSLTYDITVGNLSSSITAAHFHLGAPGVAGGVLQPITFTNNRAQGTWNNLNQEQKDALFAGRIYVNVHTTQHPDGEIRGQVVLNSTAGSSSSRSSVSSNSSSNSSMSSSSSSFSSLSSSSFSSVSSSSSSF